MRSSTFLWALWLLHSEVLAQPSSIDHFKIKREVFTRKPGGPDVDLEDKFFKTQNIPGFTSCFKVQLSTSKEHTTLPSSNKNQSHILLQLEVTNKGKFIILHTSRIFLKNSPAIDKPTLCCLSWVQSAKRFRLYFDGNEILRGFGSIDLNLARKKKPLTDSDVYEGSFTGEITDLKRWPRPLTKEEVKKVQEGKLSAEDTKRFFLSWKLSVSIISPEFLLPETTTVGQPATPIKGCSHPTASVLDLTPLDPSDQKPVEIDTSIKIPKPIKKKFEELSVCAWLYYNSTEDLPIYFILHIDNLCRPMLSFHIWENQMHYGQKGLFDITSTPVVEHGKWHHICFTWSEIDNSTVHIYLDGSHALHKHVRNGSDLFGDRIGFKNIQYGSFDPENPTKGFVSKATGIDMWDYALNPEQVVQSYTCPQKYPGNFISWEKTGKAYNPVV